MAKTMSISLAVTFALLVAACGGSARPPGAGTGSPTVWQFGSHAEAVELGRIMLSRL